MAKPQSWRNIGLRPSKKRSTPFFSWQADVVAIFLLVLITLVWHVYSQLFGFIITCYPKVAGAWAQGTHFRRLRSICVVRSSPSRKPEGPRQLKLPCSTHLPSTRKLFVRIWSFHFKSLAFQLLKALLSPPRHNAMKGRKGLNFPSSRSSMAPLWQSKSLLSIAHKYKQNGPHPSFTGWP